MFILFNFLQIYSQKVAEGLRQDATTGIIMTNYDDGLEKVPEQVTPDLYSPKGFPLLIGRYKTTIVHIYFCYLFNYIKTWYIFQLPAIHTRHQTSEKVLLLDVENNIIFNLCWCCVFKLCQCVWCYYLYLQVCMYGIQLAIKI